MGITEEIRQAAKRSGLTQTELAKMGGTSQRAISDWFAGSNLALSSIDGIAQGLKITAKVPKKLKGEG